jgi:hypothetical protein
MTLAPISLQRASVAADGLQFHTAGGLAEALRQGCFLLAIPDGLDLTPGLKLCREFYLPAGPEAGSSASYRGYRDAEGIYFDREHFQTEHVLIDGPGRARHFPPELASMCDGMGELGLRVLRAALDQLGVARSGWDQVTGGAVAGRGTHWFAANHYRPERNQLGCAPHKDTGFVTVLYLEQEGLEAAIGSDWVSIEPVPGYFVVNFGGAFELLTAALPQPVRAIAHRVRQCLPSSVHEDRFSFAAFANPPATGDLFQVDEDGTVSAVQSVEEFLREFNKATWNDRYDEFGIADTQPLEPAGGQGRLP